MVSRSEIFDYAQKEFGVKPDYPFKKFPHYAALRHSDDNKWFGLVMNVSLNKIGLQGDEEIDVVDFKCPVEKVSDLRNQDGFHPAYHMNKEHWLTARLDGSVSKQEIFALLRESYELTK
ncbi:MmcQ/YjbR family DNA-binding protein (plasmid) [Rhizobium lusitanum]|uniref:MmcQ/YjbR family DNA-binding protein n=1 Tax=Rhizobium lusitanum TaxID=293958 RepID=UPI00161D0A77|nr:MmcQ/YjbR family DNA-binding protein [Rhizobium lusitanum]QND46140.1 MmcQ/YjbR family DNA-binding protein [Rhizobium lusitanum]